MISLLTIALLFDVTRGHIVMIVYHVLQDDIYMSQEQGSSLLPYMGSNHMIDPFYAMMRIATPVSASTAPVMARMLTCSLRNSADRGKMNTGLMLLSVAATPVLLVY